MVLFAERLRKPLWRNDLAGRIANRAPVATGRPMSHVGHRASHIPWRAARCALALGRDEPLHPDTHPDAHREWRTGPCGAGEVR